MIIKNAMVFTEQGTFEKKDILIESGLFTEGKNQGEVLNAEGLIAIPGLTDLHFHGCVGFDFCDGTKEAFHNIANTKLNRGLQLFV